MGTLLVLAAILGVAFFAIFLANRERKKSSAFGDPALQSSVLTGAETDAPRSIPTEPVEGPMVGGAPVEELAHRGSVNPTGDK